MLEKETILRRQIRSVEVYTVDVMHIMKKKPSKI
jgi:hypothetical protein